MTPELVQAFISTLTIGSMYALIAVGVTLIYSATRIINFAQGEFVMLGGMVMVSLYGDSGWPLWAAIVATIAITVAIATLLSVVVYLPGRQGALITV